MALAAGLHPARIRACLGSPPRRLWPPQSASAALYASCFARPNRQDGTLIAAPSCLHICRRAPRASRGARSVAGWLVEAALTALRLPLASSLASAVPRFLCFLDPVVLPSRPWVAHASSSAAPISAQMHLPAACPSWLSCLSLTLRSPPLTIHPLDIITYILSTYEILLPPSSTSKGLILLWLQT